MIEKPAQLILPKFREDCSVSMGIEVRDLLKVRKEAVLYVQPCVSERGKLMADVELRRKEDKQQLIDPTVLCSILEIHKRRFVELRCSRSLGVAKFKLKGREISIFKNGKLKIQRALDREEILRAANSIARLIWAAVICDICRRPTIDCASGRCEQCISEEGAERVSLEEIPNAALIEAGYSNLRKAEELRSRGRYQEFERALNAAKYLALFFTVEAADKETARLGLALLGEAEKLG
ncbi:MAG: hypothetical protein QXP65_02005 [Candidatus Hadarchaeales archaeon]